MYLYQNPLWPNFKWDKNGISDLLIPIRHEQGRLIGRMESIGIKEQQESILQTMTQDVVKTSEIEGEILDPSSARSSIARHLGIEYAALKKSDRNVEGIVEVLLDATNNYNQPLTKERLFRWHSSLFSNSFAKITVGGWRKGPIQVVSGHLDKEIVHFEGPVAEKVDHEMSLFLDFFNNENKIDLIIKSALMHLWFVTIHPFDDGNGRIGRAIADMLLARSEKSSHRFYSLSGQIQIERKGYYAILEKTQKGSLDITPWLAWFLNCLSQSITHAQITINNVIHKSDIWKTLNTHPMNARQRLVIDKLLEGFEGKLTSSKWAKLVKCSQDTAHRDIQELLNFGILIKNAAGGRSTSYSLNPIYLF